VYLKETGLGGLGDVDWIHPI